MKLMIEWTFEGGLKSVGEYGTSGTEPVINQECMLVHEKEDSTCQFEWYLSLIHIYCHIDVICFYFITQRKFLP